MPNKLTDLEVDEVSAVDRPSNRRKFLIIKSAEGTMSAWDTIQKLAADAGKSVADICQEKPALYAHHCREYKRGEVAVPEVTQETPVMKRTTASDTLLVFAKAKLLNGDAKNWDEAICQAQQEHKDLYVTHVALSRGGK
jgi:hypothetical protein